MLASSPVTSPALGTITSSSGWAAMNYGPLPAADATGPRSRRHCLGSASASAFPGLPWGWPALGTVQGRAQPKTGPASSAVPGSPTVTLCHATLQSRVELLVLPPKSAGWERAIRPPNPSAFPFYQENIWKGNVVITVSLLLGSAEWGNMW